MSESNTPKRRVLGSNVPSGATPNEEVPSNHENVLLCPICSESMVSLSQLNRHIDDIHSGSDSGVLSSSSSPAPPASGSPVSPTPPLQKAPMNREFLNGSVSRWLKNNFENVVETSPLTSPQKRKTVKLDLLDKNKGFSLSESLTSPSTLNVFNDSDGTKEKDISKSPGKPPTASASRNNVNRLSRSHWQQPSSVSTDYCADQTCHRVLNIKNGKVNCRKCGLLYCNEHTYYKARLKNNDTIPKKPEILYEPSKEGTWARVCRSCYEGKPEDNEPLTNDLTSSFKKQRQIHNDQKELHRNKVTKRFIKLVNLHSDYYLSTKTNPDFWFSSSSWTVSRVLDEEKQIVGLENWQHDSQVQACPLCFSNFNFFTRRHHCRVCGRIVCDGSLNDKQIICSMDVPLNLFLNNKLAHLNFSPLVVQNMKELKEIPDDNEKFRIRCCNDCKDDLLHDWKSSNDSNRDVYSSSSEIFKLYDQLFLIKKNIHGLYPKYEKLIHSYQVSGDLDEINKLRIKLMSFLRDFESLIALFKKSFFVLTKQNVLKPSDDLSSDIQKLVNNIHQSTTTYLQETLINIKQLSNVLKEKEKNELKAHQQYVADAAVKNIESNNVGGSEEDSIQSPLSPSSLSPKPLPSQILEPDLTKRQIRELREELMVMSEQKFIIQGLIEKVTKSRKFDELAPLEENKTELDRNIQDLERKLGEFGF
ncbi:hypothetical protein CLIB1423_14S03092 [[Candida] railenensis]|uniref:FYVE-type domain-containing protein n=1 Tax=[Candida] railenensis TaxID=45579 RepID=A0A9P0QSW0_9ASCO|nr:hypothetical protein CLIB1423_14S03092 [[Candida] railenensis]